MHDSSHEEQQYLHTMPGQQALGTLSLYQTYIDNSITGFDTNGTTIIYGSEHRADGESVHQNHFRIERHAVDIYEHTQ